jgi:hypothetical protein
MEIPGTYEQAATQLREPPTPPYNLLAVGGHDPFIALQHGTKTLVRYFPSGLVFGFVMGGTGTELAIIDKALSQQAGRHQMVKVDGTVVDFSFPESGPRAEFIGRILDTGIVNTPVTTLYKAAKACFV